MKMVMMTYNEAIDDEVMEVLEVCALKNYTKITKVFGKGSTSGTHMGNDIWPGLNNMIYAACNDDDAKQLMSYIKHLRQKLGPEGVKAFVMPIDEVT